MLHRFTRECRNRDRLAQVFVLEQTLARPARDAAQRFESGRPSRRARGSERSPTVALGALRFASLARGALLAAALAVHAVADGGEGDLVANERARLKCHGDEPGHEQSMHGRRWSQLFASRPEPPSLRRDTSPRATGDEGLCGWEPGALLVAESRALFPHVSAVLPGLGGGASAEICRNCVSVAARQ